MNRSQLRGSAATGDMWAITQNVRPVSTPRGIRTDYKRVLTSIQPGIVAPIAYIPMFRQDSLRTSRFQCSVKMSETAEMLMNAVNCSFQAWFIPKLAMERFDGLDSFNKSYAQFDGEAGDETAVPFFEHHTFHEAGGQPKAIYNIMGLHAPAGAEVTTDLVESYNLLWNYRAKQRSNHIGEFSKLGTNPKPAFWTHTQMKHIKPDFDDALIDGEVALSITEGQFPVKSVGANNAHATSQADTDGARTPSGPVTNGTPAAPPPTDANGAYDWTSLVWAEMQENGVTVSLANIELAKKTRAWARLRETYAGIPDDYLVDLLMQGISLPQLEMKEPILLAKQETIFGMMKRYATNSDALDVSATNGETMVDLMITMPQTNVGGMVLITCEILPEQLFERQQDYFLTAQTVADLPQQDRDRLDPQPVEIVPNKHVDTDHSDPDATFGYAPLNHKWLRQGPNIGGRFYRQHADDPWKEDRNRIWAVESQDPQLTTDFYVANDIHNDVFADTITDPFEVLVVGTANIEGMTYFGPALRESTDAYEKVLAKVDQTRIAPPDAPVTQVAQEEVELVEEQVVETDEEEG